PVIISAHGYPASGKTTLAKAVSNELSLPFLSKDETLKEVLFDELQTSSREWSIKIGRAAYRVMQKLIEEQLKAGYSMVVESTFRYEFDNLAFMALQERFKFMAIHVVCEASPEVLVERYMRRIETGERHTGHGETGRGEYLEAIRQLDLR